MSLCETIKEIILSKMPTAEVIIEDPQDDGVHLEATVIAEEFNGLSLVKQHQLVMRHLKTSFATDLHALKLKTVPSTEKAH